MESSNFNKGLRIRPSNIVCGQDTGNKQSDLDSAKVQWDPKSFKKLNQSMENRREEGKNDKNCEISRMVSQLEKIRPESGANNDGIVLPPGNKESPPNEHLQETKRKGTPHSECIVKDFEEVESSFNLSDSVICIDDSTDFAKAISPGKEENKKLKSFPVGLGKSATKQIQHTVPITSTPNEKKSSSREPKEHLEHKIKQTTQDVPSFASLSGSVKDRFTLKNKELNDSFKIFRDPKAQNSSKKDKSHENNSLSAKVQANCSDGIQPLIKKNADCSSEPVNERRRRRSSSEPKKYSADVFQSSSITHPSTTIVYKGVPSRYSVQSSHKVIDLTENEKVETKTQGPIKAVDPAQSHMLRQKRDMLQQEMQQLQV